MLLFPSRPLKVRLALNEDAVDCGRVPGRPLLGLLVSTLWKLLLDVMGVVSRGIGGGRAGVVVVVVVVVVAAAAAAAEAILGDGRM